jgi:hypothetical protein
MELGSGDCIGDDRSQPVRAGNAAQPCTVSRPESGHLCRLKQWSGRSATQRPVTQRAGYVTRRSVPGAVAGRNTPGSRWRKGDDWTHAGERPSSEPEHTASPVSEPDSGPWWRFGTTDADAYAQPAP